MHDRSLSTLLQLVCTDRMNRLALIADQARRDRLNGCAKQPRACKTLLPTRRPHPGACPWPHAPLVQSGV